MDENGIRRVLRKLLRELDLHQPLRVEELCERLSQDRERPIVLVSTELATAGAFGTLIRMPKKDLIVYQSNLSTTHQDAIKFHELTHLILDHVSPGSDDAPSLNCVLGAQTQAKTYYDNQLEWEAETGARIMLGWSSPDRNTTAYGQRYAKDQLALVRAFGWSEWV